MEPGVIGRALAVLAFAVVAALAFRSWRRGHLNDRRLVMLAALCLILALVSVTAMAVVGSGVCRSAESPALAGAIIGIVVSSFFGQVMLAASVMGRFWRPTSNPAIAPGAPSARG